MTTRTYTLEQLADIAEAAEPFAALLQSHHADKPDDLPIYQVNNVKITFGQLRALVKALGLPVSQREGRVSCLQTTTHRRIKS